MRRVLVLTLAVCAIAVAPIRALACSCTVASFRAHLDGATEAFVGSVSSTVANAAAFDVEKVFKGDVGQTVSVSTEGLCSVSFTPGTRYVIFATGSLTSLTTTLCQGTSEDYVTAENSMKAIRVYSMPVHPAPSNQAIAMPGPGNGSRVMPIAFAFMLLFGCVAGLVKYGSISVVSRSTRL